MTLPLTPAALPDNSDCISKRVGTLPAPRPPAPAFPTPTLYSNRLLPSHLCLFASHPPARPPLDSVPRGNTLRMDRIDTTTCARAASKCALDRRPVPPRHIRPIRRDSNRD